MRGKHLLLIVLVLIGIACGGQAEETPRASTSITSTDATIERSTTDTTTGTTGTSTTDPTTAAAEPVTTTNASSTAAAPAAPSTVAEGLGFPVTVAGVVIPEAPVAIVSLSPTATEVLFALGAGNRVIAVGTTSDYPPDAPLTDLDAFQPNVEAIASYEPDLVVISWDPGEVEAGLSALGVPVLNQSPALSIDDAYLQIHQLGAATGNSAAAEEMVMSIQAEIADLVARYGVPDRNLTYYHEVDNTLYSATSSTFIGNVYALFGLENIADAADADGFGYPQLSGEYILEADPDLIFFGCAVWCGTTPETIAERPGWSGLKAVRNGSVVEVNDDISSRWGPRLIEFVQLIGQTLATLPEDRQ